MRKKKTQLKPIDTMQARIVEFKSEEICKQKPTVKRICIHDPSPSNSKGGNFKSSPLSAPATTSSSPPITDSGLISIEDTFLREVPIKAIDQKLPSLVTKADTEQLRKDIRSVVKKVTGKQRSERKSTGQLKRSHRKL